MNRKLTALALSATIAGGVGAVAVPATGAFADGLPTSISQSSETPSQSEAEQKLMAQTNTARVSVVDAGDGDHAADYLGAVLTGDDTIEFYAFAGDDWTKTGESSVLDTPFGDDAEVRGHHVDGLELPVFVVEGTFTGNGSGNALAYGYNDDEGWGVLEGRGDHLVPSGHGITELGEPGLELNIDVNDDGRLVTSSLWGPDYDASNAEQAGNPIIREWSGTGGDTLALQSERGGPTG